MNFLPLCTAIVCPTISGITVDRRDQVLMTFFSPPRFITSTFSSRGTSTKGPFFSDLDIVSYQLPVTSFQSFWKLMPVSSNQLPVIENAVLETGNRKLETYFRRLCTMNRSVAFRFRVL